ncbi:hypothetical protein DL546_005134 [Coniochaeta pulveracea]|uniref:Uncharacterized protein n=1 Tax=Coniochaeta pulveracea TaxID=177199 RepID=A0A420Y6Z1_9PEZI|nr:hypothetical protein DL546_005134 [Coniochaeta pulveracea]
MTIMVPPVVAANNSGPGTQHQVAQATLPQGQTAAGAQQYHHQPLPLAFAPGPQDPSIYHHHSLPDPASSSQGQEARHPSTSQGFPGPSQGPNARGEASSSSQTEPSAMTANATSLTPLPRSTAGNTNNVGPLSVADEVILDDGTKFKIIRESKHSTTYQKL